MGLAIGMFWATGFAVSQTLLSLADTLGWSGTFALFSVTGACVWVGVYTQVRRSAVRPAHAAFANASAYQLPETKQQSLEAIDHMDAGQVQGSGRPRWCCSPSHHTRLADDGAEAEAGDAEAAEAEAVDAAVDAP